jgi:deoxyribodipyrimidine photolyase
MCTSRHLSQMDKPHVASIVINTLAVPLLSAAGMRQLWSMGWCHNRVRVVASHFMVKHLLLPWQWGLKHLWDCQIDADLECDALGWQYVSGCLSGA